MTAGTSAGGRVADVMVTCVKTLRPGCGLGAIRAFFTDDHFHMALIVEEAGRLVTTIERPDLLAVASGSEPVATLGTLIGRTAAPADSLDASAVKLLGEGRRRLAVIDESGRLLGLLCLNREGTGYCSDDGILKRLNSQAATGRGAYIRA